MSPVDEKEISVPSFVDGCIVSKGVEIHELLNVRKDAILYVQPCASERGKLMADIELSKDIDKDFFDTKTLCWLLEIHRRRFSELKCSPSLGVAKVKWKGREMSVFRNGKLKIQRAPSREEIVRIANTTSRMVWGAVFCEVCGKPTLECASGECGKCRSGEHRIKAGEVPNVDLLLQARDGLKAANESPGDLVKLSQKARSLALHFVEETPDKKVAVAGLALLAETR